MINQKKPKKGILVDTILKASKTEKDLNKFLEGILSPVEYDTLSTRIEICEQLLSGQWQKDIAKKFGTGVATVNRVAKAIKEHPIISQIIKKT